MILPAILTLPDPAVGLGESILRHGVMQLEAVLVVDLSRGGQSILEPTAEINHILVIRLRHCDRNLDGQHKDAYERSLHHPQLYLTNFPVTLSPPRLTSYTYTPLLIPLTSRLFTPQADATSRPLRS